MRILIFFIFSILFSACASVKPLDGGEKDLAAPIIVFSSPKHFSTNVQSKTIVLKFNEYVQLNNQMSEWTISPHQSKNPLMTINGKTLTIKLLDDLKANTTYSISFGNSISDLNEGNVLKQNTFVFSTGSYLDSLSISGNCLDALSLSPIKKTSVFLFPTDSSPFKTSPTFFTKCKDDGSFLFNHLPNATFSIYAWEDVNDNHFPDADELFAFSKKQITTGQDSFSHLFLFKQFSGKQFVSSISSQIPGIINFALNKPDLLIDVKINLVNASVFKKTDIRFLYSFKSDTITGLIPYPEDVDSLFFSFGSTDSNYIIPFPTSPVQDTLTLLEKSVTIVNNSAFNTPFSLPVYSIKEPAIILLKDSVTVPLSLNHRIFLNNIIWNIAFPSDGQYSIILPSNSIKSIFPHSVFMADTIQVTVLKSASLSNVSFNILDSLNHSFSLHLIKENTSVASFYCDACKIISFNNLAPATYKIKLIYDLNRNNRWETGDFHKQLLPEPVLFLPLELKLKAGWNQLDIPLLIPNK